MCLDKGIGLDGKPYERYRFYIFDIVHCGDKAFNEKPYGRRLEEIRRQIIEPREELRVSWGIMWWWVDTRRKVRALKHPPRLACLLLVGRQKTHPEAIASELFSIRAKPFLRFGKTGKKEMDDLLKKVPHGMFHSPPQWQTQPPV